jgi:hypothetical protein
MSFHVKHDQLDVFAAIGTAGLYEGDEEDAKKAKTAAYNALKATPWGRGDHDVKPTATKASARSKEDPAEKPTPKKAKPNTQP